MKSRAIVQDGTVPTLCRMCDTRCAIDVHLKDGVMVGRRGTQLRLGVGAIVWTTALAFCVIAPEAAAAYRLLELSLLYPVWYMALSFTRGGFDRAYFYDSSGDDVFVARHDRSHMEGDLFFNYAYGDLSFSYEVHKHPGTRMGLADAGAHCGVVCDGGTPTFMLTHWTRDRSRGPKLPLEYVVRRQTRETAELYGLGDRGALLPGLRADINVIDMDALKLELDGNLATHHIYSFNELEALQKGGVQRIYTGNVRTGDHDMQVTVAGQSSDGANYHKMDSFTLNKNVGPKIVELSLTDHSIALKE